MIQENILELVKYGLSTGLVDPEDKVYTINRLLELFQVDEIEDAVFEKVENLPAWTQEEAEGKLEGILAEMMDYAYENGLMAENSIVYKDLFDTKIMGCLVPEPSSVRKTFRDLYEHTSPLAATDYFYKLSCDSNYIRRQRIKKDRKWTTDTDLLTREFHAFVNEQHFQPVFCRKSDPESKGKIENVVKYVKYNFLRGRTFHSIDQLNKEALEWLERTGNGNEHSLTHLIPSEEFQIERNCLQPYHGIPTEPRQKMKEYYVRKDNTICYHSNFYTLPCGTYKGQSTTVWVQESEEERLEIFDKETGKQITSHPLCKEKGKTVSNMAHHRVRNVPREDMEKRIVDYAGGDSIASEWMNGLRAGKPRYYWDNLNHILRFMRTFSRETFHEAMEICLDRGAYNALMLTDTARSIQKRKKEKPADLPPMSTATIPTVAQEMPEKTNINQYSSIFK